MKSVLFSIGSFHIYGYGLMIAVGTLLAYFLAEYRAKRHGLNSDMVFGLVVTVLITGWLGAKLLYYITIWRDILKDPSILLSFSNGFVVYGGIICGFLGALLYCKRKKTALLPYSDLIMPSVALAQGFGRIGCLLAGCCYGIAWHGPLGITFPAGGLAPSGTPLFPTQIASAAFDLALGLILIAVSKKLRKTGQMTALYLTCYSVGRFIIEFFRGDLERGAVGPLSTSQFIGIFTMAAGAAGLVLATRCGKPASPQAAEGKEPAGGEPSAPEDSGGEETAEK